MIEDIIKKLDNQIAAGKEVLELSYAEWSLYDATINPDIGLHEVKYKNHLIKRVMRYD